MYKKFIYQILFVMRLTIVVLILGMMQVSAISFAQKVNYVKKQATLEEIFEVIRAQTGYNVFYSSNKVDDSQKMDVRFKDTELKAVLDLCAEKQSLAYNIEAKNIFFKPKEKNIVDKIISLFSAIDIRGKVVDEQGQPLPGASVKVKSGTLGTVTNKDGEFFLKGVPEDAMIVIAYLGYKPLELKAGASLGIIKLEQVSSELTEVVINKGYYTTTKALNTGSVSKVTAEEISRQPVSNPLQAMQSRTPGIYIAQESGIPGSNFQVRIRGINSIQNGNNPLYLIDGIPFTSESMSDVNTAGGLYSQSGASPLNSINPNDIESVEILKDADATAIYGSRGANGVVLITTKKGVPGKVKVEVNARTGISKAMGRLKMMDTKQYLLMRFEALANDGQTLPLAGEYDINGTWDQSRYTDWQDVMFGRGAHANIINGSISGGSKETQFHFNAGLDKQGTVFPGNNSAQRISTLFSVNHNSLDKRFKASFSNSYSRNKNDLPWINMAITGIAPNAPAIYDADGEINWEDSTWDNPFAKLLGRFTSNTSALVMNGELGYTIIKDLNLKGKIGINDMRNEEIQTIPNTIYRPSYNITPAGSILTLGNSNLRSWIAESQLDWLKQLGRSTVSLLIGVTFQDQLNQTERNIYEGFTSNSLINDPAAASTRRLENYNNIKYRYAALYSRIGYNWNDKYLVNITGRRDASSRFGPNRQFANLGAIGVAWIFSGEDFLKDKLPFMSFGKLRASYGITGNDQIGDYRFLDTYRSSGGSYQSVSELIPFQLFNPSYGWEKNRKLEAAIEFAFLNNKLSMTAGYYRNRSSNQLINYELASTTGFSSVLQNSPATVQNTGIEAEISNINVSGDHFKWSSSVNLTIPRNKLISFPDLEFSSYRSRYAIGKSLTLTRMFHYLGVDPQTGIFQFEDLNGDGKTNYDDRLIYVESGQEFYGGIVNNISYKSFQIDFLLQFVGQRKLDSGGGYLSPGIIGVNQPVSVLDGRWKNPGDIANSQFFSRTNPAVLKAWEMYTASDVLLGNASFIRLKNLSISYDFTNKIIKEISGNIFAQGQNLLTFSSFNGLDPESNSLSPLTTFVFGIQLKL